METVETPEAAFGRRMQGVRERRGWSQRDLVARLREDAALEMDPATIARIETGQRRLRLNEAITIAWVLGVNPARLFLPLDRSYVQLAEGIGVHPDLARKWIQGHEAASRETEDGSVVAKDLDVRYREEEDWRLLEGLEHACHDEDRARRALDRARDLGHQGSVEEAQSVHLETLDAVSRHLYRLRRLGIDVDDLVTGDLREALEDLDWWDRDLEGERTARALGADTWEEEV